MTPDEMGAEAKKLAQQARAITDKIKEEKREPTDEEDAKVKDLTQRSIVLSERAETERTLATQERRLEESLRTPPGAPATGGTPRESLKPFANLGEQMRAIWHACKPGADPSAVDLRLRRLKEETRSPSGMHEGLGSEGGFPLQTDFAGILMDSAVETGRILSMVDTHEIGAGFDSAKWIDVDETSVATTVFGGVQVYWKAEGDTVDSTKPKTKERELKLQTLFGLGYASDEEMEDVTWTSSLFTKAFTTGIQRTLEGDIIAGTGAGRPLGMTKSPALVSVTKEDGQDAGTVLWKNIVKMWHRTLPDSRGRLIWLSNPDTAEQLEFMEFPIGTGGVPVYLPPAAAAGAGWSTLKARPVIVTDHCPANGSANDLMLVDPTDYLLIRKGGVRSDVSIHVRFIYGEQTFRFAFRANGILKRSSKLTIKNSSVQRSSVVGLGART
jgi:HK97 family phage major capsid protein